MGLKTAVDIFQEVMTKVLVGLDYCRVYLDDILIISDGTYEDHLQKVSKVLKQLEEANFRCNLCTSFLQ